MKKALFVLAHQGDESIFVGGTIAKYAKAGWHIDLLCSTQDDHRKKELELAATILGISTVTSLGFKDGTISKSHSGHLEELIYKAMVQQGPDIVVTFDSLGMTNHPDHRRISQGTTFAYQKYAIEKEESKLYYACFSQTLIEFLQKIHALPKEYFDKPLKGIEDKHISTVIDISKSKKTKLKAIGAHKSQDGVFVKLFDDEKSMLLSLEYFNLRMTGIHETFMGKNDTVSGRL